MDEHIEVGRRNAQSSEVFHSIEKEKRIHVNRNIEQQMHLRCARCLAIRKWNERKGKRLRREESVEHTLQ